jgi:tetratricopeptide (TPR) repeat protein
VTSEQSGSGQVIKICLEEIDRSRPYFVCSLGFRNGWALMPSDNPADQYVKLLEQTFSLAEQSFEWIKYAHDRSVTELEILHGALNDPALNPRCFFYFRDVDFLTALPKNQRKLFAEIGEAEKRLQQLKTRIVASGFRVRYFNTPQMMSELLEEDLRKSIEQDFPISRLSPLEREVKDHQAFAEMRTRVYVGGDRYLTVLDQFLLDEKPDGPQVLVLSGASGAGKSSAIANWMKSLKARAKRGVFHGKKQGDEGHAKVGGGRKPSPQPSPALGSIQEDSASASSSSSGNGSQVFHWNTALFLDRYIGSTSDSTSPGTLLRWIVTELCARINAGNGVRSEANDTEGSKDDKERNRDSSNENDGGVPALEVPQDLKRLIEDFPEFITLSSAQNSILLVLDGLDQLYEEEAQHLAWLPKNWPRNVKVVLSTVVGSTSHKTLLERQNALISSSPSQSPGITFLNVEQLSDQHAYELMTTFLGSYGKKLDQKQEERIMACERTRLPLYLITFLQEVRVFGSFENLTRRIDHYMEASSVSEMFLKVIGRLEEDFDSAIGIPLVRATLSLLLVARRGLNEPELKGALEMALGLSAVGGSFPNMEFSALMLRLDQQLVDQRGLRKFGHNYLRQAVETKYFTRGVPASVGSHKGPPASHGSNSTFPPLGYVSQSFIRKILAEYFASLSEISERKVEEGPWHLFTILQDSMGRAWVSGEDGDDDPAASTGVEGTTSQKGPHGRVGSMSIAAGGALASTHSSTHAGGMLGGSHRLDLASIQKALQDQITDLAMFDRLRSTCVYDLHKYWLLLESIRGPAGGGGKGKVSYTAGCYSAALKEWVKNSAPAPPPLSIASMAESIGTFLIGTDRYTGADLFLDQSLDIRQQVQGPDHGDVETLISKKANLFYRQGRYEEALPLYKRSLEIVEKNEALDPNNGHAGVRSSVLRTSIAGLLKEQGKYAESQPLYEKSLADKIKLLGRKHPVVAVSMSNLAELHLRLHHPERALPLYQEALTIMENERGRSHPEVATIVSSLASCLMHLAKYDEAIRLYERARKIKEELLGPQHVSVAIVLNNLAATYQKMNDAPKALKLLERSLKIRQNVHGVDSPLTAQTLNNMGEIYLEQQKYRSAQNYFQQALDIMVKDKGHLALDLMGTLTSMAKLHFDKQEFDQALPVYQRQLEIMESNYGVNDVRIIQPLNNIGMVLQSMNSFEKALPYHLRELKLARVGTSLPSSGRGSLVMSPSTALGMTQDPKSSQLKVAEILMILGVLFVSMDKPLVALPVFKRCFIIRRDVLGLGDEQTQEPRGWIADLSDDAEDDDAHLARLKLDRVPEPPEIDEKAQNAACLVATSQSQGGHVRVRTPSRGGKDSPLPGTPTPGATPGHRASLSIGQASSKMVLPPIAGASVGGAGGILPPLSPGLGVPSRDGTPTLRGTSPLPLLNAAGSRPPSSQAGLSGLPALPGMTGKAPSLVIKPRAQIIVAVSRSKSDELSYHELICCSSAHLLCLCLSLTFVRFPELSLLPPLQHPPLWRLPQLPPVCPSLSPLLPRRQLRHRLLRHPRRRTRSAWSFPTRDGRRRP